MSKFMAMIARDRNGYEWVNPRKLSPRHREYEHRLKLGWISLRNPREETIKIDLDHCYDPIAKDPALFRIFAGLQPTPEAILAFANEYAPLATIFEVHGGDTSTLAYWREQIKFMRDDVELADSLLASEASKLNRRKNAEALEELVGIRVHDIEITLRAASQNGNIILRHVVYDLLSAMRLQLVEAITERKTYRSCEYCNKPFEVTPQVNRADRLFCSDNCRVKAYQRRKKQAIELRLEGRTLRQIATETGSEMDTVKRWLKDVKPKEK